MGANRVTPTVVQFFVNHPNRVWSREEVADRLGLTQTQVRDAARYITNKGTLTGLKVIINGTTWEYVPPVASPKLGPAPTPAPTHKRVFEEVGPVKGGGFVIQDEDGNLYRAEEL